MFIFKQVCVSSRDEAEREKSKAILLEGHLELFDWGWCCVDCNGSRTKNYATNGH